MKIYRRLINVLLFLYLILYPILPTYGNLSSDLILYILIFSQFIGFTLLKSDRENVFYIIKNIFKDKIFLSLLVLNLIMYVSSIVSSDIRITLTNSIRFSMYIFVFYSITYKIKETTCKLFFNTFISVGVLSGIYTVLQLTYTKYLGYKIDKTVRMTSFLENPNNLGAYSILIFFIVLILFINSTDFKFKLLYFISTLLILINIMFSQSRNALLAIVIGGFIIAVLYDKRLILLSFICPIIFFLIPSIRSRIYQIFDMSQNSTRFDIWKTSASMIKENAFLGIGYENFSIQYPIYASNTGNIIVDDYLPLHPHNIFLKIQTELGILGTLAFIFFIIITIITLYKVYNKTQLSNIRSISIAVLTSFLTFLFMNQLDCFLNTPKVIVTLFVLLAFINNYKINKQKRLGNL